MIKVLVVSTVGLGLYGITNSIMNYYQAMDKTDLQIDFLSPHEVPKQIKDEIQSNGGKVYENIERNKVLTYMLKLSRILKDEHYDIIHAHGNSRTLVVEMLVAKLCKVKVRIAHCHSSTCNHLVAHRFLKYIFNYSYTHVFACSEKAGKWLCGERPFTVVNNGIPIEKFYFNKKEREYYRKKLHFENNKVIGHVGHFSFPKNQEFLLDIFSKMHQRDNSYRLLLVGDGDLRKETKKLAEKYGVKDYVCFFGETYFVSKLMQVMDIFAFPSRFEGFGMVVIEAQAAGLPCVVSDVVPPEAKIVKELEYLSLEASPDVWINKIDNFVKIDREDCFMKNKKLLQNSNYNIKNEADKLRRLYQEYVG